MTGFAGLFSLEPLDRGASGEVLAGMARDITYAAGDATESWTGDHLAVTRVHHGVLNPEPQPIFNEDGSLCIVMDGEVFDYERERRSLKSRGHQFRFPGNDAEYCMHLYEEYGTDAFAKLNGSFALMLYDRIRQKLLLINDRFSSYPLFYSHCQGDLAFGTQLRPLLRWDGLPRRLDAQAVYEFSAWSLVLPDRTHYQDVKALSPANVLRFRRGQVIVSRYWQAEYGDQSRSEDYYTEALAYSLKRAIERRTRGRHRLGVLLSGGLDSRSVLAGCEKPLTAFTIGDFENREMKTARSAAAKRGCAHVFLRRSLDHYANFVREAVDIGDGMLRFDHAHLLGVLEEMRAHCDVLLDTYGFDAKFKGAFLIHRGGSIFGRSFHGPRLADVSTLDVCDRRLWVRFGYFSPTAGKLFRPERRGALHEVALTSIRDAVLAGPKGEPHDLVRDTLASPFRCLGPYLMVLAARAHLPQRSIVFDNDLLEVSLSLPARLRARGRLFKRALKTLSPDLAAIPNANTGLRADLPVWPEWFLVSSRIALQEIGILPEPAMMHPAYTDSAWPDMRELIRHSEPLRTLIEKTLLDPRCIDPDLFCVGVALSVLDNHLAGKADHTNLLFRLLTFGQWHKRYGPR